MDKAQINPWSWQDRAGFSQGWKVEGSESLIFVSGQGAISADGELVGEGDFAAQAELAFQNLGTVLEQAGASFAHVVKLTVYLTDAGRLREYMEVKTRFIEGDQPASTALQVAALALPGMMIEVEAVAAL